MCLQLIQRDTGLSVVFLHHHRHHFAVARRDILSDIIRADGQFTVAPVDQDSQLDGLRPAVMENSLNGGTDRTAGIDHVIHQDHLFPGYIAGNDGVSGFRQVAAWWLERHPAGLVLALGSKAERSGAGEAIEGLDPQRVRNLAGETSIDELMLVLQKAEMCLANDSGIMHLSAALGGQGVAVFGSTDPAATSPVSGKWKLFYDKLPCSPCFKRVCPLGTKACLARITPGDVTDLMAEMCV